ncbi:hypothetical protein ACHAW6_002462 [Cyclotella cf. meneghiniana]
MWLREILPSDTTKKSFDLAISCFATFCYNYKQLQQPQHKNCILFQSLTSHRKPLASPPLATPGIKQCKLYCSQGPHHMLFN